MSSERTPRGRLGAALLAAVVVVAMTAGAATGLSGADSPDVVRLLSGYSSFWRPSGADDLHGVVSDAETLEHDDALVVWINRNATAEQRRLALQDAEYQNASGTAYDQSITLSTGLGSRLGPLYVRGRTSGALPRTSALINSSDGTAGAAVHTGTAKATFSHPRPYVPTDPAAPAVPGDAAGCAPSLVNASSLAATRVGKAYADARGALRVRRVPATTDTSHRFSPHDVRLDAGYGTTGICTGGSFPSGHATTAFEAGITLATLLPELAPELLARASEAGNDRIVLGVHYPLDVVGGRIDGEAAIAARWSDRGFRDRVLLPARAELVRYLETTSGHSLHWNLAHQKAYTSNPYAGRKVPGGTAQIVTDRRSAVRVYRERLTYGSGMTGPTGLNPSVPVGAADLLRTTFPTMTSAQRSSVLAQTELPSGHPLDGTGTPAGAWQRLDLAAAMSARVVEGAHGGVTVTATGGTARLLPRACRRDQPATRPPEGPLSWPVGAGGPADPFSFW